MILEHQDIKSKPKPETDLHTALMCEQKLLARLQTSLRIARQQGMDTAPLEGSIRYTDQQIQRLERQIRDAAVSDE